MVPPARKGSFFGCGQLKTVSGGGVWLRWSLQIVSRSSAAKPDDYRQRLSGLAGAPTGEINSPFMNVVVITKLKFARHLRKFHDQLTILDIDENLFIGAPTNSFIQFKTPSRKISATGNSAILYQKTFTNNLEFSSHKNAL